MFQVAGLTINILVGQTLALLGREETGLTINIQGSLLVL
jgi:hypothetical protein